jgi:hypothetical protein
MFVEHTPIPNLKLLRYRSDRGAAAEEEILSALASKSSALTDVFISAKFDSSDSLLKIVGCFRELRSLVFDNEGGGLMLERSDIIAVASLSRLKALKFYRCGMTEDAYSALMRLRGLNSFQISSLVDPAVLAAIGRSLVSLKLRRPSKEVVEGIVEHCPNLQYLELVEFDLDDEEEELVGSIKSGLKKLAKFKLNEESIRLGSDWEGYEWHMSDGE